MNTTGIRSHYHEAAVSVLKGLRHEKGWEQKPLSRHLGMHEQFITKLENGNRYLGFDEFIAICKGLDADPSEIFERVIAWKRGKQK